MSKKKYINLEYVNLFPTKRDFFATADEKTNLYNKALIALRTQFRQITEDNKKVAFKMMHFNKLVKSKYQDEIVNVIKMYLKEDQFDLKK